jgi:hypothetical protein
LDQGAHRRGAIVTPTEARELAGLSYELPAIAAELLVVATDPETPHELWLRASHAVGWLDRGNPLPIAARTAETATETVALSIAALVVACFTRAGRVDRARIANLLLAVVAEASKLGGSVSGVAA